MIVGVLIFRMFVVIRVVSSVWLVVIIFGGIVIV